MDMDSKSIEQLIERYWRCETSLDDEKRLKEYFAGNEIAPHLMRYKSLFAYQTMQLEEGLDSRFDEKVLNAITEPMTVRMKPAVNARWFVPLLKIAAVLFIVAYIANVAQDIFPSQQVEYDYDAYTDTYDSPEVAYQEVTSALLMVSESMNQTKTLLYEDSLSSCATQDIIE